MDLNEELVWWLVAGSVVMFIVSLVAIPAIIIRLPADYFLHPRRHAAKPQGRGLILYYLFLGAKNLAGVIFVLMGMAMLVLPGQGVLSMLIGLSMINFPGKYRLEKFIVSRKPVLRSMNWIRHKAGKSKLRVSSPSQPSGDAGTCVAS